TVGIIVAIVISHLVWPEQTWLNINNLFLKSLQIAKVCCHDALKISGAKMVLLNINEFFQLLVKLHSDFENTKFVFFSLEKHESWSMAVQSLDRLAESIATAQGIPKENLVNIFDESLTLQVEKFIEEIQSAFEELQSQCMEASSINFSDRLKE